MVRQRPERGRPGDAGADDDFVVRRQIGGLGLDEQAAIIAAAVGPMGPNADYLARTVAGLAEIGVRDEALAALEKKVLARLGG